MITRRKFMAGTLAGSTLTALGCSTNNSQVNTAAKCQGNCLSESGEMTIDSSVSKLTQMVNGFIGTGGHGHTYPGATVPFGMVQLSPDTSNRGWDSCSGYHQQDASIMGFSHTHLSGTGCADMLDFLVVPCSGKVKLTPGSLENPQTGYRSRYDRKSEISRPGYYAVTLSDSRVHAELSATQRAGIHRYTFPKNASAQLLIDLCHGQQDWWVKGSAETRIKNAELRLEGNDTLVGGRQVFQWANGRWIFFALKVSRPFQRAQLFKDDQLTSKQSLRGEKLKSILTFDNVGAEPLLVKVGISAVDIEGALANLDADIPDFDFQRVATAASEAWEQQLSRVKVSTQNNTHKVIFNTCHYHALMAPTLFSDVDGRYRGMDNKIHNLAKGEENYSTYSLWDTYRTLHPFFTLTQSQRLPAMLAGLVRMSEQSPAGAPIWPLQGRETDTMIGYHSASVLAEAWVKKVPGVDYKAAYKVIRKRAFDDDVHGFALYREKHYIPANLVDESVSRTLEFAYSDWAASKLATAAGETEEAAVLRQRAKYYANVFDKSVGFVRGKLDDGTWVEPFTPDSLGHNQKRWRDFTETNSWQATFLNQHDIYGYMALFGGPEQFEAKLDALFTASSEMTDGHLSDISGLIGQYAHGNEPSHHVAYLYAYCGAHYKTQSRVQEIRESMYQNAFDGLSGNEDCGQMSAWYLMSAIGFYPVDPASGVYVLGAPMFQQVEMDVGEGKQFLVTAENLSGKQDFIQSVKLNGQAYSKSYLPHSAVVAGGTLHFIMGSSPNKDFGKGVQDRPPSFV